MSKIYKKITIVTEEQNVSVMPTEEQDGIIIETVELDHKTLNGRTYLTKDEAIALMNSIQEMINHLDL